MSILNRVLADQNTFQFPTTPAERTVPATIIVRRLNCSQRRRGGGVVLMKILLELPWIVSRRYGHWYNQGRCGTVLIGPTTLLEQNCKAEKAGWPASTWQIDRGLSM